MSMPNVTIDDWQASFALVKVYAQEVMEMKSLVCSANFRTATGLRADAQENNTLMQRIAAILHAFLQRIDTQTHVELGADGGSPCRVAVPHQTPFGASCHPDWVGKADSSCRSTLQTCADSDQPPLDALWSESSGNTSSTTNKGRMSKISVTIDGKRRQLPSEFKLIAEPPELALSTQMLVSSRIGDWLEMKGCMGWCIAVALASCVALTLLVYFTSQHVHFRQGDTMIVDLRLSDMFGPLAMALCLLSFVLVAHRYNRQLLLLSMKSFDSFAVNSSGILCYAVIVYHRHRYVSGTYDVKWRVHDTLTGCVYAIGLLLATNIDCFSANHVLKTCVAAGLFSSCVFVCVFQRCASELWGEPIKSCSSFLDIGGISRKEVFLGCAAQLCVFTFKGLCGHLSGSALVIVRPKFVTAGRCIRSIESQPDRPSKESALPEERAPTYWSPRSSIGNIEWTSMTARCFNHDRDEKGLDGPLPVPAELRNQDNHENEFSAPVPEELRIHNDVSELNALVPDESFPCHHAIGQASNLMRTIKL